MDGLIKAIDKEVYCPILLEQSLSIQRSLVSGSQYDARRYTWIGRINSNVEVHHTWHASGVRTIDDAKRREVILAGTGPTSSSVVMPRLMNELIGTRFKVVTGFQGPTSAQLAFERGEVEGIVKPWSSIKTSTPDWLRDKKINLLVQHTQARHPELKDVPTIVELGHDEMQRQIFALFSGGAALGTALLAPPGVPERTAAALRAAFDAAMRDAVLLDEVRRSGTDIDPMAGIELHQVVDGTFNIVPDVLERARKLSP